MIVNFNRSSPIMVNEINHVRGLLLENQKKKKNNENFNNLIAV